MNFWTLFSKVFMLVIELNFFPNMYIQKLFFFFI
jgi:hypothetical protein